MKLVGMTTKITGISMPTGIWWCIVRMESNEI